jgi:head-tail adaptor
MHRENTPQPSSAVRVRREINAPMRSRCCRNVMGRRLAIHAIPKTSTARRGWCAFAHHDA